jgi:hypothetical protein
MAGQLYSGLPANIVTPAPIAILSSTAANPIVVQTSSPHGLRTGDYVDIVGHSLNIAANCVRQPITFVDATHFSIAINGAAFGTAGGNTGGVRPLSFRNNVATLPINGDAYDMTTYLPGYVAALDRDSYLFSVVGYFEEVAPTIQQFSDAGSGDFWTRVSSPAPGSYLPLLSSTSGFTTPTRWTIPYVHINDIVEIALDTTVGIIGPVSAIAYVFAFGYSYQPIGGSPSFNVPPMVGSAKLVSDPSPGPNLTQSIHLRAIAGNSVDGVANALTLSATVTVGTLVITPYVLPVTTGAATQAGLVQDFLFTAHQYRPTGVNP